MGIQPKLQAIIPPIFNRRYDFTFNYNNIEYVLEYDGTQHFNYIPFFHRDDEEEYRKRRYADI